MKYVTFREYIKEILRNSKFKPGENNDVVIGISRDLPGCLTQGNNFEEAHENLIDAIELWISVALREGEELPEVNGCLLAPSRDLKLTDQELDYA